MLGIDDLKDTIQIAENTVECPVRGCTQRIMRQRRSFKRDSQFKCPDHGIYISPSTFEYETDVDNLLWATPADLELLSGIKKVKRESRMARDNSEDALSWNVFRFLENSGCLDRVIGKLVGASLYHPRMIYWAYDQMEGSAWSLLNTARLEFGEEIIRGSEPDIIIDSENVLLFVECKLMATNETIPSNRDARKKYETGGNRWFNMVFRSDYETVAIASRRYELMRFWLLGTWMAQRSDKAKAFILVNLVPESQEIGIEGSFGQHIVQTGNSRFLRLTWESICRELLDLKVNDPNWNTTVSYYRNKSLGYDGNGQLKKAFII